MLVVFRVDASNNIGSGHVMRCLTLADTLKDKYTVVFICREHIGNLCELIEKNGFRVYRLPFSKAIQQNTSFLAHAAWLGCEWQEDAKQTYQVIQELEREGKIEWLIVDHYAIDKEWEKYFRPFVARIMVIDDLADREHDCDLLLDQNLIADRESHYRFKVPPHCKLLLGPKYALLQPIYSQLHKRLPLPEKEVKRIFIYFGASDNYNFTSLVLEILLPLISESIYIDAVIADTHPCREKILQNIQQHKNARLYGNLKSLAPLMAKANLAIGAGGVTSWERLCLRLPSIVITVADNQIPIAQHLEKENLIYYLGSHTSVSSTRLREAFKEIVSLKDQPRSFFSIPEDLVDGKGAIRTSAILKLNMTTSLNVRNYYYSDSILSGEVFEDYLRDIENCKIYVIEDCNFIPVAVVGFLKENNIWNYKLLWTLSLQNLETYFLTLGIAKFHTELDKGFILKRQHSKAILYINICSDTESWLNEYIPHVIAEWIVADKQVAWHHNAKDMPESSVCFYMSYGKIVSQEILNKQKVNLVIHESDLPKGRGWSPLTWQVLEGAHSIKVTLLEAATEVDGGVIYDQEELTLSGHELVDELRLLQAQATFKLAKDFIKHYPESFMQSKKQEGEASYYRRRTPVDSKVDTNMTIKDSFNLLRVCDKKRYPAWFEINSVKYFLTIEKCK